MLKIRKMTLGDAEEVKEMMRVFYASEAVMTNGSEEIFESDVRACLAEGVPLEGLIFDDGGKTAGYAMLAGGFSTEFGKPCLWVEDLYIKPEHRRKGIGRAFFEYVDKNYRGHIVRLEAERENLPAVKLYKSCGFEELPYLELKKEI